MQNKARKTSSPNIKLCPKYSNIVQSVYYGCFKKENQHINKFNMINDSNNYLLL